MRKLRLLVVSSIMMTVLLLTIFTTIVAAQDVITIRMGMIAPEGHPVAKASSYFADLVERRTEGRIKIETFPGGTLGGETELADLVQSGVLKMANIGIGGAYSPKLEAPTCLFYLFPDQDAMWDFYGSVPYKEELLRVENERNTHFLSMNWWQNWRHLIANRAVEKVADFSGLRLRYSPVDPLKAKFYEALGAVGEPIEFPDVYESLQRGVADGFECPLDWIYSVKSHEVVKHLTLTSHITYLNSPIVNKTFWEEDLSPAEREVIREAAWEAGAYQNDLQEKSSEELLDKLKEAGVHVYEFSTEDMQELVALSKEVQLEWAEEMGVTEWLQRILETYAE